MAISADAEVILNIINSAMNIYKTTELTVSAFLERVDS